MINLTLKQLRYVEALAQHGHFGRAADACSVSQPALSMQIKELEASLGTALFERSARQSSPRARAVFCDLSTNCPIWRGPPKVGWPGASGSA
jgi:DNA-binding MarR family transcriptional regulator